MAHCRIRLVWFIFWASLSLGKVLKRYPSKLVYIGPKYSVQNPNLTIAAFYDFQSQVEQQGFLGISAASAVLCALNNYNQGKGLVPVKGTFNAVIHDSSRHKSLRQNDIVKSGMGQNMFYLWNRTRIGDIPDTSFGVILADGSIDTSLISTLSTAFLPIPMLYTFSLANSEYSIISFLSSESKSLYNSVVLSNPSALNLLFVMKEILDTFDWTLVGIAFSSDNSGFPAQEAFYTILTLIDTKIVSPCVATIASHEQDSAYTYDIERFSTCIKSTNQLRVIVLIMSATEAAYVANNITTLTGLDNKLVFIVPSIAKVIASQIFPPMTFFLTPSGQVNNLNVESKCSSNISPLLVDLANKKNLTNVSIGSDYCYLTDPDQALNGTNTAFADGFNCTETNIFTYAYDSINTVMEAIYNMQSNCSKIDACVQRTFPFYTKRFCDLQEFDLADLSIAIKCVNFTGLSGQISFINGTTFRTTLPLNIYQVLPDQQIAAVGFATNRNVYVNQSLVYFYNNQTIVSKIVVDDPNITNNALVAVFFGLDVALMVMTVAFALFIVVYWRNRVIRKSSPTFCLLMLLGLLFGEMTLLLYSMPSSDILCRAEDWFLLLGISLIIGGLLAKNYRIYRIFGNRSAQALKISDLDLFCFTGAVILITSILLVLYMTVGGPLILYEQQSESNSYYFYTICLVGNSGVQTGFTIAFYVYFVLLFFAAAILAFLNRKVDDAYNESGDLGFIACSWIALATIYAPIYYIQSSETESNATRFTIRYMAIELAILFALVVLFVPKILATIHDLRRKSKQRSE